MKIRSKSFTRLAALAVAGALSLAASAAQANIITIFNGSGTSAGVAVDAKATFDAGAGQITITLENLTAHTADAAQLLTGLQFKLKNGATTLMSASLFSKQGMERNVPGSGVYTEDGPFNISWELVTGSIMQLDFNPDAKDAILGPADGETASIDGVYHGNGSINGNPGHNPFVGKSATFVIKNAAITQATAISNVTFLYNTGLSQSIPGTPCEDCGGATPEPASLSVLALGGLLLVPRKKK